MSPPALRGWFQRHGDASRRFPRAVSLPSSAAGTAVAFSDSSVGDRHPGAQVLPGQRNCCSPDSHDPNRTQIRFGPGSDWGLPVLI